MGLTAASGWPAHKRSDGSTGYRWVIAWAVVGALIVDATPIVASMSSAID